MQPFFSRQVAALPEAVDGKEAQQRRLALGLEVGAHPELTGHRQDHRARAGHLAFRDLTFAVAGFSLGSVK